MLASKVCIRTHSSLWIVQSHPPWNEQFPLSPLAGLWGKLKPEIGLRGVSSSRAGATSAAASWLLAIQTLHPNTHPWILLLNYFQTRYWGIEKTWSWFHSGHKWRKRHGFQGDIPEVKTLCSLSKAYPVVFNVMCKDLLTDDLTLKCLEDRKY